MSTNGIFVIIATLAVIGISFTFATLAGRRSRKDASDWNIGGRSLPLYVIVGTQFASAMGGGVIVGQVGSAYTNGISMIFYGLFASLPFVAYLLIGKWIRTQEFETIPDMIADLSGGNKPARIIAAILTIVVPFGWLISNLVAFAKMYTQITGIPLDALILVMTLLSLLFVMPAGMKTVAWTDFFFACIMAVSCVLVAGYCVTQGAGISAIRTVLPQEFTSLAKSTSRLGWSTLITWLIACLPGGMTNQMYFQRVCALDSVKKVNRSLIISGIALFVAFAWACFIGNAVHVLNPSLEGENATGWLLTVMPTALIAIFAALITATIMSTISSAVQSIVVNCTHDIYKTLRPEIDESRLVNLSRVLSLITLFAAAILGMKSPQVLDWIVYTYSYSAAGLCVPMYVGYFMSKKKLVTPAGLVASMLCGIAGCIAAQVLKTTVPFVVFGIAASILALFVVCACTRSSYRAEQAEAEESNKS